VTVPEDLAREDILVWCFQFHANTDRANAAVHMSPVRYSPITFALAEELGTDEGIPEADPVRELLHDVLAHRQQYPLDRGRIELDSKEQD
jgi:hypothetical protein